ncbi:MAG TPA: DUF503 domain-containing protein [Peptococcaceae bacterium]|nr:DUF503 domain-containing protein [Peptococcaceae bacterium]
MIVGTLRIKLYAPWVHSLKEKRMELKSIIARTENRFKVAIAEVDAQDVHQTMVLGIACVTQNTAMADSVLDKVMEFIERNTEAEIVEVEREIR